MKKWFFLGIAVVLFVLVILALPYIKDFKKKNPVVPGGAVSSTVEQASQEISTPWIEVVTPVVILVNNDGTTTELKTGDQVKQGDKIKTDNNGIANIYFPDGSVARLDTSTEITIDVASYDEPNQSLVVKIFVSMGKVWSKIIDLATPNSSWQVETTNAVATVRGTAFAVQVTGDDTEILGSEHDVTVRVKDSGNVLSDETVVGPDKYLKINKDFVSGVVNKKIKMQKAVQDAPDLVKNKDWIKKSKDSDTRMLDLIKTMNINTKSAEGRKLIRQMMQMLILKKDVNYPGLEKLRSFLLQIQSTVQQNLNGINTLQPNLPTEVKDPPTTQTTQPTQPSLDTSVTSPVTAVASDLTAPTTDNTAGTVSDPNTAVTAPTTDLIAPSTVISPITSPVITERVISPTILR